MPKFSVILLTALLTGCTYNIPTYQARNENLSFVAGGQNPLAVIQEKPAFDDGGSIVCRATGPVTLPDGYTFSSYITNALKDELKTVNLLSENAASTLHVKVKKVDFSSSLGASNWYIDTDYILNEKTFSVSTVYNDRSSYFGSKACNNMAQYFQKAVAEHLRQLYSRPEFRSAIGFSERQRAISTSDRFQKLQQLFKDGLITEQEYNDKKKRLLNEL